MTHLPRASAVLILARRATRDVGCGEQRDGGLQVLGLVREEAHNRLFATNTGTHTRA